MTAPVSASRRGPVLYMPVCMLFAYEKYAAAYAGLYAETPGSVHNARNRALVYKLLIVCFGNGLLP